MTFDPLPAAEALIAARAARRRPAPLPAAIAPRDEAEARAVQFASGRPAWRACRSAASRSAPPASGCRTIWASTPRCAGFMAARTCINRSRAAVRRVHQPGVECELAVRLGADLPPGPCTFEQAVAAVGELFAAIEIVENRYGDLKAARHADAGRRPVLPCRRRARRPAAAIGGDWTSARCAAASAWMTAAGDEGVDDGPARPSAERAGLAGGSAEVARRSAA